MNELPERRSMKMCDSCNKNVRDKSYQQRLKSKRIHTIQAKQEESIVVFVLLLLSLMHMKNIYNQTNIWFKQNKKLDVIKTNYFMIQTTDISGKMFSVIYAKLIMIFYKK